MKLAEIFPALKTYWDSDPGLTATVPGGLWFDKADQDATAPYAVITGTEEAPELFSGTTGIQWFGFTVGVWSSAGATDARDIQRRIALLFKRDNRTLILVPHPDAKVLDLQPSPSEYKQEGRKGANEVIAAMASYRMLLQLEF